MYFSGLGIFYVIYMGKRLFLDPDVFKLNEVSFREIYDFAD
jgi:hypothetical protein